MVSILICTQIFIQDLKLSFFQLVNLNFFGEKHGKNSRDMHFSNLSRFIEAESLVTLLSSPQDVVNAINKRQQMANDNSGIKITYY